MEPYPLEREIEVENRERERERERERQAKAIHYQRHTCNLPIFSHSKEISHGCGCGWTSWQAATWPTGHKNQRRYAMFHSNQYLLLASFLNTKTHPCPRVLHGPMGHGLELRYWTDAGSFEVTRCNLDGTDVEVIQNKSV